MLFFQRRKKSRTNSHGCQAIEWRWQTLWGFNTPTANNEACFLQQSLLVAPFLFPVTIATVASPNNYELQASLSPSLPSNRQLLSFAVGPVFLSAKSASDLYSVILRYSAANLSALLLTSFRFDLSSNRSLGSTKAGYQLVLGKSSELLLDAVVIAIMICLLLPSYPHWKRPTTAQRTTPDSFVVLNLLHLHLTAFSWCLPPISCCWLFLRLFPLSPRFCTFPLLRRQIGNTWSSTTPNSMLAAAFTSVRHSWILPNRLWARWCPLLKIAQ